MKFGKFFKKLLPFSPGIGSKLMGQQNAQQEGYDKGVEAGKSMIPGEDVNAELSDELKNYEHLGADALAGAEADARRAGTYADTREFQTQLAGEASARQRGLGQASRARINALRAKLGLPALDDAAAIDQKSIVR